MPPEDSHSRDEGSTRWIGRSLERFEDAALLRGAGQFIDDLPVPPGQVHVAFLRSPLAHADIDAINTFPALELDGVIAVITGEDIVRLSRPFITGVRIDAPQYALATDRVRYVGEPLAMVVAIDRYRAEDALDAITVAYTPRAAVSRPTAALEKDCERLHSSLSSNVVHDRSFSYGQPEMAVSQAAHTITHRFSYPRNHCTPIECCGVMARYNEAEDIYEVVANFQGPYTLHTVMARSLNVPTNRLRLKTPPDSGGSFGVKQAVFPYVVALALAAKVTGRPVKWIEDRIEHLSGTTSATNRETTLTAAFASDGRLTCLDYDQIEDCGAYLRAPEPATLYRMHGNMTGAYRVENLRIRNRVVVTNKTPTGLMRGFGGPQVYFPLERIMDMASAALGIDPLKIRRINLVRPEEMPYRTASGALLDSGDYPASLHYALEHGGWQALLERRTAARTSGRLYGIGCAAVVEPSVSNMGYITTLLTPSEREASGPKNGALASATVSFDPGGSIAVTSDSIPQGQGHRTVLAQVVADVFGVEPATISVVSEHDTLRDPWSIAAGNYSSRFAAVVAGTAYQAACRLRERLARIAANELNVLPDDIHFGDNRISSLVNPDNHTSLARCAAAAHWSPLSLEQDQPPGLRETVFWTMPQLTEPDTADRINSSGSYGFIFDFCGVEIDPVTSQVKIDKYVTLHDAGILLNPMLADGQIRGGFAHAVGAALYEELAYSDDGNFLSGTLADYLLPTVFEVPEPMILHFGSPSSFTPLGAKGLGEGNSMSTPVCLANAVADALDYCVDTLPMTASRVDGWIRSDEPAPPASLQGQAVASGGSVLEGSGTSQVAVTPLRVWQALFDEATLANVLPGCHLVQRQPDGGYYADLSVGVGPVRGRFQTRLEFSDLDEPRSLRVSGTAQGPLGVAALGGVISIDPLATGAHIQLDYQVRVTGKIVVVGSRLVDTAVHTLVQRFLSDLALYLEHGSPRPGVFARIARWARSLH